MPTIRIDFDEDAVSNEDIELLGAATIKIMQKLTGIDDCFVYANSSQICINVAPIELYIELSAEKISDREAMFGDIKSQLHDWKAENEFSPPINVTFKPMNWNFTVDV